MSEVTPIQVPVTSAAMQVRLAKRAEAIHPEKVIPIKSGK